MIPHSIRKIHFIGVGGAGMSAIAWTLLQRGYRVSGSDLGSNSQTRRLEEGGARILQGHAAENLGDADVAVISSAIPDHNVERRAAVARGIPVWARGKMLAEIMESGTAIAVAGAHGKTTTTSMLGLLLARAGLDPTVLIGGELNEFGGNARAGGGECIVAEADESDGSFLLMRPDTAIVTNVDADHLDHWKSWERLQAGYVQFLRRIRQGGRAIVCIDGAPAHEALKRSGVAAITCGLNAPDADWQADEVEISPESTRFACWRRGQRLGTVELRVPGRHNVSNALLTLAAGAEHGLRFETACAILREYRGALRRWQRLGEEAGIRVMDDYGHHPAEIEATLGAARASLGTGGGRLAVVFQPHRYTRTLHLADSFGPAFRSADIVVITDIYPAGERPIEGVSGQLVFQSVQRHAPGLSYYVPRLEDVPARLLDMLSSGDTLVAMGAGDVARAGQAFLEALRDRAAARR